MPKIAAWLLALGCATGLAACANINSIGRSTALPQGTARDGTAIEDGLAVHLDAQQRVVLVNGYGKICSEPSPDALAAFAASLGLGASVPGTGAGSLAAGQQSSAASIGLRTQSITLMRDALFRMCEAAANDSVGPAQVASLLARSQDLTAVILAVEQLTGAIAANQVALTGTTAAGASAALLANQELLDSAREAETEKQAKLEEAEADLAAVRTERDQKAREEREARAEHDRVHASDSTASDLQKRDAQAHWEQSQRDLERAKREVEAAENLLRTRQTLLDEARRVRETLENAKDSALTNASAGTTASSQFSTPIARRELSKEATEAIAVAVQAMVMRVLSKEYTQESCMAILTYIPRDFANWNDQQLLYLREIRNICRDVALRSIGQDITTSEFAADTLTDRIEAWIEADPANRGVLAAWLGGKGFEFSVTTLLFGQENAVVRRLAVNELGIP